MRRSSPAVPALLALVAVGAAVVQAAAIPPGPRPSAAEKDPAKDPGGVETAPVAPDPTAEIPSLASLPLEARIALGEVDPGEPTTTADAEALAKSLAGRLGRPSKVHFAPGIALAGTGDAASLGRIARRLAGIDGRIRDLLRMTEPEGRSQLVLLEVSRDAYEFADAALFGQAPIATRTAVLGVAEGHLVVTAWWDPDVGSLLAATARTLASAAIIEGGLLEARPATPEGEDPTASSIDRNATRPPAWFLEGLASQLASVVASPNALEPRQRETGLHFLRGGGDPRRVFALAPDDPAWIALDGVAQSVAFLAVQRLAEDAPASLDRLIGALRAGRSWPSAWKATLGGTPASLAERLVRHHAVND